MGTMKHLVILVIMIWLAIFKQAVIKFWVKANKYIEAFMLTLGSFLCVYYVMFVIYLIFIKP